MKLPRNRLTPYKILVLMLYGRYSWMSVSDSRITVVLPALAHTLRMGTSRVKEHFHWLQEYNFIMEVTFSGHSVSFYLREPCRE